MPDQLQIDTFDSDYNLSMRMAPQCCAILNGLFGLHGDDVFNIASHTMDSCFCVDLISSEYGAGMRIRRQPKKQRYYGEFTIRNYTTNGIAHNELRRIMGSKYITHYFYGFTSRVARGDIGNVKEEIVFWNVFDVSVFKDIISSSIKCTDDYGSRAICCGGLEIAYLQINKSKPGEAFWVFHIPSLKELNQNIVAFTSREQSYA